MSVLDVIGRIARIVSGAPPPATTIIRFSGDACVPATGEEIVRDRDYFSITLNEMYLTKGREFWSTYDPLVFVSVDFIYGPDVINVASIVGPNTLRGKQELPHGFLINDIKVVGPHPFRGGSIAITVVLYKTKNQDYAKRVLQFAEGISKSIGVPAGIELVSKVGSSLLDAFETLVAMGDCVPVTGHRVEINSNTIEGFVASYTALVAGEEKASTKLLVKNSRLMDDEGRPYRRSDFVLYSIARNERRDQETTLPFYDMLGEIDRAAMSDDAQSWARAKASLVVLYQKMLTSPDLTPVEADSLFEKYKQSMMERRERALKATLMSGRPPKLGYDSDSKFDQIVDDLKKLDGILGARDELWSPTIASEPLDNSSPRVVDFLYVTTRKKSMIGIGQSGPVGYTGQRSVELGFGAASVRIPEDHKIGQIELPVKWSVLGYTLYEGSISESRHFSIRKISALTQEQWEKVAHEKAPQKRALIFVHGFNTSFEDALYRNAQIIWDLQYPGLSVLFSWASAGRPSEYFYDRDSAYLARDAFVGVLRLLKENHHFDQVDVIAHSMGNLVVLDALSSYAKTSNPAMVGELVMAAPDVDRDQFLQMGPIVRKITKGMTLYASSADKALALSRIPARVPRAGDVAPQGPIVLPDIETIDVTAIGDEIFGLNHTEFASNRAVIDDMKLLIWNGMRPPRLAQIRGIPDFPAAPKYWRYVP
ncbi:esterase/lipase superfamily enzyme [Bradyrhizobium sp. S3.14.4]